MAKTHVAYDTRSGQIISVHHGELDAVHARERAQHHAEISGEHIGIITIASEAVERGKLYKVDVSRKALVEATGEGVGFSFRIAGPLP